MDKRIKKTERAITNALFHFLNEKELNKISVREICEYAGINRGTFYLHYLDIYDLMDKVEQKMVDRIYTEHFPYEAIPLRENADKPFDYIKRHKDEYKTLIEKNTGFISKFTDKILSDSVPLMERLMPEAEEDTLKNASYFFAGGVLALLHGWLANDCKTPYNELLSASRAAADYIYHRHTQ